MLLLIGLVCTVALSVWLIPGLRRATDSSLTTETYFTTAATDGARHHSVPLHLRIMQAAAFAFTAPPPSDPPLAEKPSVTSPSSAPSATSSAFITAGQTAPSIRLLPDFAPDLPAASTLVITTATTRLTFAGELRPTSAAPLAVAFDLQYTPTHRGGLLAGVVRIAQAPDTPPPLTGLQVTGVLFNRTLTLSEPGTAGASLPGGYVFVIELLADPANGQLSGSWSHGAIRGTLVLTRAQAS